MGGEEKDEKMHELSSEVCHETNYSMFDKIKEKNIDCCIKGLLRVHERIWIITHSITWEGCQGIKKNNRGEGR